MKPTNARRDTGRAVETLAAIGAVRPGTQVRTLADSAADPAEVLAGLKLLYVVLVVLIVALAW